jgi:hypothetical protein
VDYLFYFQHRLPTMNRNVENVVVSFESFPTLSLDCWLSDDLARCARNFLQSLLPAENWMDHLCLRRRKLLRAELIKQA